jgi:hypothetical protein
MRPVTDNSARLRLAKETYILLAICAVDLAFTAWLVTTRHGIEGNPLMSYYLHGGWAPLLLAKLVLVIMPIFIAEWARRYHPVFVRRALQFAIVVYLAAYGVAFANGAIQAR